MWIPVIKLEKIASLAKQTFSVLELIKYISVWNQVQKSLPRKPSNPYVVCSSLILEYERYIGAENQNCEKEKKAATNLRTLLQGKYSH